MDNPGEAERHTDTLAMIIDYPWLNSQKTLSYDILKLNKYNMMQTLREVLRSVTRL